MLKRQIYLDLDGVMFDFEGHYLSLFGHTHDSVSDSEMWKNIHNHGHFFKDIPLYEGAYDFFAHLVERYGTANIQILTACPKSDYTNAARYKREAVREHLSIFVKVLPMLHGKNKVLFMHEPGDILIDDFEKNIKPWNEAGGFGILHKNFEDTKTQLRKIISY